MISSRVVTQIWREGGNDLRPLLPRARQLFYGVVSRDPRDIQLREINGVCQVVCFPDEREMKRIASRGLQRGADGVVVIAEAANWHLLLGLSGDAPR